MLRGVTLPAPYTTTHPLFLAKQPILPVYHIIPFRTSLIRGVTDSLYQRSYQIPALLMRGVADGEFNRFVGFLKDNSAKTHLEVYSIVLSQKVYLKV